jgi:hypothetical protein
MDQKLKKSVRKLVTLPRELAEQVDAFRQKAGSSSESDALKTLIEGGLKRYETPKELFARCEAATNNNQPMGDLITSVIGDHPLVESTRLDAHALVVNLVKKESESPFRFVFMRSRRTWSAEWYDYGKKVWDAGKFDDAGNLVDDEIPF